ncbi:MAG: S-ribosylhomocysteine lyase [Bacilli bacterium]|nr:S-ribosylhomocysteine lyase [Bacilli bacterium]
MQSNVISFKIDHSKLLPGLYLHEVKDCGSNYVTTYDFRFKRPNMGDYLTPCQSHTIEHVMATFFTAKLKDKLYWGPMGCLTGFYLVLNGKHGVDEVLAMLDECESFWQELLKNREVPAKNPYRCGNYKLLDINEGYKAWNEFYSNRNSWGKEYPIIDECPLDAPYKSDIDYKINVK